MSLRAPDSVYYFAAVMYNPLYITDPDAVITDIFGGAVLKSAQFPFDHTAYYESEMGEALLKYFVSFGAPDEPGRLPEYKHKAIVAEDSSAMGGKRIINVDPGYLAMEKVVVASTKNFTHRVYLADGIFGDVQLMRRKGGGYTALPWTYADYMRPEVHEFFAALARRLI